MKLLGREPEPFLDATGLPVGRTRVAESAGIVDRPGLHQFPHAAH